jgi:hypothetical protein
MSITNQAKPTTSLSNATKINIGETWASITTTWATEARTWADMASIIDNVNKPLNDIILATPYPANNTIAWTTSTGSYTNNTEVAPDGNTTAQTHNYTLGNNAHYDLYKTFTGFTPASIYKVSIWVKLGTSTNFSLVVNDTTAWNTIGGQVFTTTNGLSTTNWKEISYYWTQPTARTSINLHLGANQNNLTNQTAGSVYIWGVKIEQVASLTPSALSITNINKP